MTTMALSQNNPLAQQVKAALIVSVGSVSLIATITFAVVALLFDRPSVAQSILIIVPTVMFMAFLYMTILMRGARHCLAPAIVCLLAMPAMVQIPEVKLLGVSAAAERAVAAGARTIGKPSALEGELRELLSPVNRQKRLTDPAFRARLQELARAKTSADDVLMYMVAANALGLDTSHVNNTGLVRARDMQALEDALAARP